MGELEAHFAQDCHCCGIWHPLRENKSSVGCSFLVGEVTIGFQLAALAAMIKCSIYSIFKFELTRLAGGSYSDEGGADQKPASV